MNVFTQVYNTAEVVFKTVASTTTTYGYAPVYVSRYAPTELEMVLMAIGATAIVVVVCTALVLGFNKLIDFFNDVHTIAENSKKEE